jgi:hypothetical protein
MQRRDLVKLPAVKFAIFSVNEQPTYAFTIMKTGKKLVVFLNEDALNKETYDTYIKPRKLKDFDDVVVIPIRVPRGKTFNDVIKGYELSDESS